MKTIGEAAQAYLKKRAQGPQLKLVHLWQEWAEIMGEEIAELVSPLGHRKSFLQVGAVDTMALQEASYYVVDILKKANEFLETEFFTKVELHLLLSKNPIGQYVVKTITPLPAYMPAKPEKLGNLTELLHNKSPLGQWYTAYVAMFQAEDAPKRNPQKHVTEEK